MVETFNKNMNKVHDTLEEMKKYQHAASVLNFDLETICPPEAKEEQGNTISFLSNAAYKLRKSEDFIAAHEWLYEHLEEIENEYDKLLIEDLHFDYLKCNNITPEIQFEFSEIYQNAFIAWEKAKKENDYSKFKDHLKKVKEATIKELQLSALEDDDFESNYDAIFDEYEEGMTSEDLDKIFGELKPALIDLLNKIKNSKKTIRTDFMSRYVSDEQQRQIGKLMLDTIGFDWKRGAITTSEHPFTEGLAKDDARVTTHFYPEAFNYSMYSCLHEGGHAIFEQNGNKEAKAHFYDNKSMAQHESVSRLYENLFGSSKEFVYAIFDKLKEIIPNVLNDVTPQELYEALNVVTPSLIRTEADELTYSLHVIIRYEIEKMIVNDDNFDFDKLPELWNKKYKEYLGIEPPNDSKGVLQDVHWSGGFGYFPTYALGNIYNAMYYEAMSKEIDVKGDISKLDFSNINKWMIEKVFVDADKLDAGEWIESITGKEFTAKPFINYLTKKYSEIYQF